MEKIDYTLLKNKIASEVRDDVIPWLKRFIEVENTSRAFDPAWDTNGLLEQACALCLSYADHKKVKGMKVQMYKDPGTTPIVFGTIEATNPEKHKSIMIYGHIDKQPPVTDKWRQGLHPTKPVEENGLLYGRGAVDDGYNFFTIVSIIKVLQELGIPHDRYILFYECDEESGSKDIEHYLNKFKDIIKKPDAMFCLDTHSISTKYFSMAVSLRGVLSFDLSVRVLDKGMHSGMGSGVVPSTFRICRLLLERIECAKTGKMVEELQVKVPADKLEHIKNACAILKDTLFSYYPLAKGVEPITRDTFEAYTNRAWTPQMEVIGQEGIPLTHESGNVLRDQTVLRCSVRLPPTLNTKDAYKIIKDILEKDPPYNAQVSVDNEDGGEGWNSNEVPKGIIDILGKHTKEIFGTPPCFVGNGSSIPFIKELQDHLPETLLFVSGAGLPDSLIHGPNEHLNIEYLINFTKTLSCFLTDYVSL